MRSLARHGRQGPCCPIGTSRSAFGPDVIAAGCIDGPPREPWHRSRAYPLAVDVNAADGIAAVSFAVLDLCPEIERGWWCQAVTFALREGRWRYAAGENDNTTAPDPFSRPAKATNSVVGWCDWASTGDVGGWSEDDPPTWRHTFFGIAPTGTARLTVTDETGRTRELQITPWNGAYVAMVAGVHSTLTGYDGRGRELGSFKPSGGGELVPLPSSPG